MRLRFEQGGAAGSPERVGLTPEGEGRAQDGGGEIGGEDVIRT